VSKASFTDIYFLETAVVKCSIQYWGNLSNSECEKTRGLDFQRETDGTFGTGTISNKV
jgi:hypothetical protein